MITIITKKRWQQIKEDFQRLRCLVDSHRSTIADLHQKVLRLEKELNEVRRENRNLSASLNKMKKGNKT